MNPEKIQITEANNTLKPTEIVDNSDKFLLLLKEYKITNLGDKQKVQIQKDGDRYVFTLFDITKEKTFAVPAYDAKNFIEKFLDNQKKADEYIAVELAGLQLDIIRGTDKDIQSLKEQQKNHEINATDPYVIEDRIKMLKEFFKNQRNDGRWEGFRATSDFARSKQEREYRRLHKEEAKKRLKDLENIEKSFIKAEKGLSEQNDFNKYLVENEYKNISQQLDELSDNVPQFLLQNQSLRNGNADITPFYDIDIKNLNKSQAKKLLKIIKDYNTAQSKVTEKTELASQQQMRARDLVALQEYLEKVVNSEIDPSKVPFTPEHQAGYNYLVELYNKNKTEFPGVGKQFEANQQKTEGQTNNGQTKEQQSNTANKNQEAPTTTEANSWNEAFSKKGLNGLVKYGLDKTNMSPEQKNFWGGAANLAMVGGLAFLGWKFFRNSLKIFSKKGRAELADGDWGWIAGPLIAVFGTQALTGENPWTILNGGKNTEALMGLFGLGKGKEQKNNGTSTQQSVEQQQYVEGLNGAMALFNGKTYKEVQTMLTQDSDGKMKIKSEYFDPWKEQLEKGTPEQQVAAKFLESIGKDDPHGMIDLALTGMGITWDKLAASPDTKFNDQAAEVILRVGQLYGYMQASNKDINPEMLPMVKNYIKNNTPTLDELKTRYDVFVSPLNLDEGVQQAINAKIDALGITDPKQKKAFTEAFYRFYQNFPAEADTKKYIDIIKKGNDIVLRTYHYETKIDLASKTIPGFLNTSGYPLGFESYQELLNVANLTNRIKYLTKDWVAQGDKPFSINAFGNIEFNNTKWYDLTDIDKRILTEEGLKSVSPRLGTTEKQAYLTYLNDLGTWKEGKNSGIGWASNILPLLGFVSATDENKTPDNEVKDYPEKLQSSYDTIDALATTPENKKLIKKALNMFYEKYPRKDIKVELTGNMPLLSFESYGKKTYINIDNKKELQGLNVSFDNFFELFKAANLTNRLRDIFKNTPAKSIDPFHVGFTDITYDDASALALETDTSAISAGFFGDLKVVSRKLYENKDFYSDYLNNLWLLEDKSTGFFAIENANLPFDTTQNIIKGFKEFYKAFPNSNKEAKLIPSGTDIALQTYETNTPLDLVGKKIVGLDVTFPDYFELFKAANLINRIKQVTKDKQAGSEPFNKSLFGRDIEFNQDHKFLDTEVVSAGLWGSLDRISPQLEKNKDFFIKYLDQKRADKLAGKFY